MPVGCDFQGLDALDRPERWWVVPRSEGLIRFERWFHEELGAFGIGGVGGFDWGPGSLWGCFPPAHFWQVWIALCGAVGFHLPA